MPFSQARPPPPPPSGMMRVWACAVKARRTCPQPFSPVTCPCHASAGADAGAARPLAAPPRNWRGRCGPVHVSAALSPFSPPGVLSDGWPNHHGVASGCAVSRQRLQWGAGASVQVHGLANELRQVPRARSRPFHACTHFLSGHRSCRNCGDLHPDGLMELLHAETDWDDRVKVGRRFTSVSVWCRCDSAILCAALHALLRCRAALPCPAVQPCCPIQHAVCNRHHTSSPQPSPYAFTLPYRWAPRCTRWPACAAWTWICRAATRR